MDGSTVSVDYRAPAAPPGPAAATPAATPASSDGSDGPSFHDVLSALNPLQYLPVVGTIYRAVTGDTIPEGLRVAGSFVVSALTGGPLGLAINAAATAAEKLVGIDPETIAQDVARSLGLAPDPAAAIQEAGGGPSAAEHRAGLASYARIAQA